MVALRAAGKGAAVGVAERTAVRVAEESPGAGAGVTEVAGLNMARGATEEERMAPVVDLEKCGGATESTSGGGAAEVSAVLCEALCARVSRC